MGSAAVARPQASASASAVWQAQGVSGWLPVGRGPSRAPPAVAPPGSPRARAARTWSARASHALVGLPALAAPSAIRRPREGPRRVGATAIRVASGISPGTLEERDPDMSRVTSVISVLSPPQVPEFGRTCGARCPIAAVVRAVRAPAARAGHVGVPPGRLVSPVPTRPAPGWLADPWPAQPRAHGHAQARTRAASTRSREPHFLLSLDAFLLLFLRLVLRTPRGFLADIGLITYVMPAFRLIRRKEMNNARTLLVRALSRCVTGW